MAIQLKTNEYLRIKKGSVSSTGFKYFRFKNKAERDKFTSAQLDGNGYAVNMPMVQEVRIPINLNVALPKADTLQNALVEVAYPYLKNLQVPSTIITTPFKDSIDA